MIAALAIMAMFAFVLLDPLNNLIGRATNRAFENRTVAYAWGNSIQLSELDRFQRDRSTLNRFFARATTMTGADPRA